MLVVVDDPDAVEADLAARRLACPDCGGPLAPWGFASERELRTLGGTRRLRPRRSVCSAWGATQTSSLVDTGTYARQDQLGEGQPVLVGRRWAPPCLSGAIEDDASGMRASFLSSPKSAATVVGAPERSLTDTTVYSE